MVVFLRKIYHVLTNKLHFSDKTINEWGKPTSVKNYYNCNGALSASVESWNVNFLLNRTVVRKVVQVKYRSLVVIFNRELHFLEA